ncbi:MAG: energy-coupling factor ABC transporter ATP-binding protein [Chloroflexota bacterium]
MIRLSGLSFRYAGAPRPSLRGLDLAIADGSVTALVGPNGAGKTTLALLLAGLAPGVVPGERTGTLEIDGSTMTGTDAGRHAGSVGICLADPAAQRSGIHRTAWEEAAMGAANLGLPRAEVIDRVADALDRLGIGALAERDPARLSGGEQQLVAIAGLLAMRPRHLVLDEPTAQLDLPGTTRVLDALAALAGDGTTIVIAEHRTDALAAIATDAVLLDAGALVAAGPAATLLPGPLLHAHGVEERWETRLARVLAADGLRSPLPGGPAA